MTPGIFVFRQLEAVMEPEELVEEREMVIGFLVTEYGIDPFYIRLLERGRCSTWRQRLKEAQGRATGFQRTVENLEVCEDELRKIVAIPGRRLESGKEDTYFRLPKEHDSSEEALGTVQKAITLTSWMRDYFKIISDDLKTQFKGKDTKNLDKYLNAKRGDLRTEAYFLKKLLEDHKVKRVGYYGALLMYLYGYTKKRPSQEGFSKDNDDAINSFLTNANRGAKRVSEWMGTESVNK